MSLDHAIDSLSIINLSRKRIHAVAIALEHKRGHVIAHVMHRAIAIKHVHAAGVRAAE